MSFQKYISFQFSFQFSGHFYLRRRSMAAVCQAIKSCKSHVLTNKGTLKLGHIGNLGLLSSLQGQICPPRPFGSFDFSDKGFEKHETNLACVREIDRDRILDDKRWDDSIQNLNFGEN